MYEVRNALVHYGDYVEPIQLQNRLGEFLRQVKGIKVVQGFVYISLEFARKYTVRSRNALLSFTRNSVPSAEE
jgi:hypothetical protein